MALVVLVAGLATAVWIDRAAERAREAVMDDETLAAAPLAPGDSKRYGYQMGQGSGAAGGLMEEAESAWGWATHGRPLAVVVAVVSVVASGALMVVADKREG